MAGRWNIGERRQSAVNFLKLICDLRQQFPYDSFTALVVETFANSLDAKATHIDIHIDSDTYKILDNGKGMNPKDFEEYHNIASLTKTKGAGIGFAGVGAKIFLDEAEYIITETKSQTFHCATKWAFRGESLEWEPINRQNNITYPTGTYVEVKLRSDKRVIVRPTPEFVKKTLQQHYNAVLLGYYHVKRVRLNGEIVGPWQPREDEIEKKKEFDFMVKRNHIRGFFVKSRAELPEEFQGPFIVVHGKTVRQWWFKQYPLESETFTGLILADYLIDILTTSKSDFERTSGLWKKFQTQMGKVLSEWIDEIGAKPPSRPSSPPEEKLAKQLEKSINDVLKLPEFTNLANNFFQNITRRQIGVESERGEFAGIAEEGRQRTTGTLGGTGEGTGVDTKGEEGGNGIVEDKNGDKSIERVKRGVKGGIKIGYGEQPENLLEGWIDLGEPAIIVNRAHPAWKVADRLDSSATRVKAYHILRTVFNVLVEEIGAEDPKETAAKLFSSWYELTGELT